MTTYPFNKLVFQDSASIVSYACERIIILWIWKYVIAVLAKIHILLPFYLILTRGPIFLVKTHVILGWKILFKVAFRCMFYVLAKNHGDPYYEPTIVVHDIEMLKGASLMIIVKLKGSNKVWSSAGFFPWSIATMLCWSLLCTKPCSNGILWEQSISSDQSHPVDIYHPDVILLIMICLS